MLIVILCHSVYIIDVQPHYLCRHFCQILIDMQCITIKIPILNNCLTPHLNLLSPHVANGDKVGQHWSILCCNLFIWHCFISRNMTGRPPPRPTGPPGNPRPIMARGALPSRPLRPPPPPIGALRQMMGRGPGPLTRPPLCPPGVRLPPPRPPIGRPTAPAARPMPPTLPVVRHVGQMVPPTSASAVPPSIQKPTSPPTFATGPLQQSLPLVQSKILIFYSGN
jgi:hypothetical protein